MRVVRAIYERYWLAEHMGNNFIMSELRSGDAGHSDRDVGSNWLSLVGAAECSVADMDALDPRTLSSSPGDREAVSLH
jgi:hypothetical protein